MPPPGARSDVPAGEPGDAAFDEVWRRYSRLLFRRCLFWTGGDRQSAEEAFSRLALTLYLKLPEHAAELKNLRGWLLRLAYNACMDVHRENKRRAEAALDAVPEASLPEASHGPHRTPVDPEETYLLGELRHRLKIAIDELPERLRSTLVCYLSSGGYAETAERLTITQANARKRIQEARDILRRRLADYLEGDDVTSRGRR